MRSTLNLRQIESFRSVMLPGSVVGAARLMSVTQPAVSRAVGLLELRIGYKLFERRGRRLVPTPEGEALYREIEPLDPVPLMAVIPAGHRLAAKRLISLKDLDGERMILLSQVSFVRYQIEDAFSKLGVAPHVVLETPSSSIACALVAAGAGITLVSRWTAEPFAGADVVVKPVKESLASRQAIIFPEPGARLALADSFANELREEIRQANPR